LLEFRDSNSIAPNKIFDLGSPEITLLDPDDLRWKTALLCKLNEVGVGCYDCETVKGRVVPNDDIRCELRQPGFKDVRETGKQIHKPMHEPWREIGIQE
jgi:hypothetical protein